MTTMHKTEDHHHTAAQLEAHAREACDIADRIGLDDADRSVLLPVLLTLLSSKQVFYEQVDATGILNGLTRRG